MMEGKENEAFEEEQSIQSEEACSGPACNRETRADARRRPCPAKSFDGKYDHESNFKDPSVVLPLDIRLPLSSGANVCSTNESRSPQNSLDDPETVTYVSGDSPCQACTLPNFNLSVASLQESTSNSRKDECLARKSVDGSFQSRVVSKIERCAIVIENVDDAVQGTECVSAAETESAVRSKGQSMHSYSVPCEVIPYMVSFNDAPATEARFLGLFDQRPSSTSGLSHVPSTWTGQSTPPPDYNSMTLDFLKDEPPRYQDVAHVKTAASEKIMEPRSKLPLKSKILACIVGLVVFGLIALVIYISERYE